MKYRARAAAAFAVAAAFVVAICLYAHGIAATPLSYDEGATLYFARLPLADLWGAPAWLETNPPLFYTIEHFWVAWAGESEAALRMPGVLFAALCVPVAAAVAHRLGGARAAIAAAFLVATSPVHMVQAQEARAYSLLAWCVLLAVAASLRLGDAQAGRRARAWGCYVLACIAALYAHDTASLIVAALSGAMCVAWLRGAMRAPRFLRAWVVANAVIAAAYLPWLPIVVHQTNTQLAHFWLRVPSLTDLRYSVMNAFGQPYAPYQQRFADLGFLGLGLAGLWFRRRNLSLVSVAGSLLLGVPALNWIISQWRPIMNGKTLEWMAPLFLVLVALGATRRARFALPMTAVLVTIQLLGCAAFFANRPDEAFNQVAARLRADSRTGDVLYSDPASNLILLRYYGFDPRDVTVYASAGADPWYRESGFAVRPPDSRAARLWILTRTGAAVHAALLRGVAPGRKDIDTTVFGRGRMRNLRLALVKK